MFNCFIFHNSFVFIYTETDFHKAWVWSVDTYSGSVFSWTSLKDKNNLNTAYMSFLLCVQLTKNMKDYMESWRHV